MLTVPHGAASRPSARRQCIQQICIDEAEGEHDRQAQRDGCQVGVQGGAEQQVPASPTTNQLSCNICRFLDLPGRPRTEDSASMGDVHSAKVLAPDLLHRAEVVALIPQRFIRSHHASYRALARICTS